MLGRVMLRGALYVLLRQKVDGEVPLMSLNFMLQCDSLQMGSLRNGMYGMVWYRIRWHGNIRWIVCRDVSEVGVGDNRL